MATEGVSIEPIAAPTDTPALLHGEWVPLPLQDPVVKYVTEALWDRAVSPTSWEVARLSQAAYIYRETATRWSVVAKFYVVKTSGSADRHAEQEFNQIEAARASSLSEGPTRVVQPLALWRGVLFLEHVDGLTLEDVIAVRRSRPGTLKEGLKRAAAFLAALHTQTPQPDVPVDFQSSVDYARKVLQDLVEHGVLKDDPITAEGLTRLIDRWAADARMADFPPTLNHGDATTTNFIFPWDGGVVVIDWERAERTDPAADLGRLLAEVSHSISRHGGRPAEAAPAIRHVTDHYRRTLPPDWDGDALLRRAAFYQATSTLRIARNGWLSRLERTALVAQAMALLS